MSAFVAIAIKNFGCDGGVDDIIMEYLDLPDIVKQNIKQNLMPYLGAIELDGYEPYKMRKMMIVGNTGKFKQTRSLISCFPNFLFVKRFSTELFI